MHDLNGPDLLMLLSVVVWCKDELTLVSTNNNARVRSLVPGNWFGTRRRSAKKPVHGVLDLQKRDFSLPLITGLVVGGGIGQISQGSSANVSLCNA
ncbi:hypothetical protein MUK42_28252 [Musa troglodytarum]|uniref:Uncharacterized protein n=1 Tax=Musa troglodytarum TaxID=320322 RepID=A0A9E7GD33_9LILI|nr:hypothetical protein MUK42_28252 [Musa troglodytarum]